MNKIKERIEYWLDTAKYDLDTAKVMLESKRYLHLGFMCHLVIEKSIKAYYWYFNKSEPPYTHNLFLLAEKSGLLNLIDEEKKGLINELIPLNIQARYPEDKKALLKKLNYIKSRSLFKETKEFYQWIEVLLK